MCYGHNILFFLKKNRNKFPFTTENQYICSPKEKTYFYSSNIKQQNQMTKADIINKIVADTGLAKKDVAATVEAFMEEVRNSLSSRKEDVFLRGFGSFIVKHRAAKTARNISKNTTIIIDAHDFPAFKPAKSFIAKMK